VQKIDTNPFLHEPCMTAVLQRFIKPGDACIDAGAYVGYFSIVMAKLAGPDGCVLAIEPDPVSFKKLTDNLALNNIDNVSVLPVGLWHECAELDFTSVDGDGASCLGELLILNGMRSEKIKIKVAAIDDILMPGLPIRAMKIDCEGAEANILLGASDLLQRGVDCILCELHNDRLPAFGASQYSIRAYMAQFGYACYLLTEDCRRPALIAPEIDIFHDRLEVTAGVLFAKPDIYDAT
jgi:FkbM family methyltransferase